MPPLEEYLKDCRTGWRKKVVNNAQVGKPYSPLNSKAIVRQRRVLFYRTVRRLADNHRKFDVMSEREEVEELSARYAFAGSLSGLFTKRHAAASLTSELVRIPDIHARRKYAITRVANLLGWGDLRQEPVGTSVRPRRCLGTVQPLSAS